MFAAPATTSGELKRLMPIDMENGASRAASLNQVSRASQENSGNCARGRSSVNAHSNGRGITRALLARAPSSPLRPRNSMRSPLSRNVPSRTVIRGVALRSTMAPSAKPLHASLSSAPPSASPGRSMATPSTLSSTMGSLVGEYSNFARRTRPSRPRLCVHVRKAIGEIGSCEPSIERSSTLIEIARVSVANVPAI